MQPIAYSIDQACEAASTSRSRLYEEIKAGRLIVAKVGRRTVVPTHRLAEWLAACEVHGGKVAAANATP